MTCENCKAIQFSANDISYLHLFGICWDCDKSKMEEGQLSIAEFEKREKRADAMIETKIGI